MTQTTQPSIEKIIGVASQMEAIKQAQEEIATAQKKVLSEATNIDPALLIERATAKGFTADTIGKIGHADVEEIFAGIDLEMEEKNPRKILDFKQGILEYFVRTSVIEAELDEELGRINEVMKESAIELDAMAASFGDIDTMVQAYVHEELEKATGERKTQIERIVASMNQAETFDDVYDTFSARGVKNVKDELAHRAENTLRKMKKNLLPLGKTNVEKLTAYGNLEAILFGEDSDEAKTPNLFLFTVMRHLAFVKEPRREREGVFVSQLLINLKHVTRGTMPDEKRARFEAGVRRILNLYV